MLECMKGSQNIDDLLIEKAHLQRLTFLKDVLPYVALSLPQTSSELANLICRNYIHDESFFVIASGATPSQTFPSPPSLLRAQVLSSMEALATHHGISSDYMAGNLSFFEDQQLVGLFNIAKALAFANEDLLETIAPFLTLTPAQKSFLLRRQKPLSGHVWNTFLQNTPLDELIDLQAKERISIGKRKISSPSYTIAVSEEVYQSIQEGFALKLKREIQTSLSSSDKNITKKRSSSKM